MRSYAFFVDHRDLPQLHRQHPPRRLIRLFQRHLDAALAVQEQRHVRQGVADGDGFDVGGLDRLDLIRGQGQGFVFGQRERLVAEFAPDGGVNAISVVRAVVERGRRIEEILRSEREEQR